jgi:hypothetical protein
VKINCTVRLPDLSSPPSAPPVPPLSMPCRHLPQCRCHAITASLGVIIASLKADVTSLPPPSVLLSPPSTLTPCHCRLPRCSLPRCRVIASLNADAAPLPPPSVQSPSTPRRHLPQLLTLLTLLCSVQSASIVLGVIALFIGLISSMMICGVVRLERDSLRVLVS